MYKISCQVGGQFVSWTLKLLMSKNDLTASTLEKYIAVHI